MLKINSFSGVVTLAMTLFSMSASAMLAAAPGMLPPSQPTPPTAPTIPPSSRVSFPVPSLPNRALTCSSYGYYSATYPNVNWVSLGGQSYSVDIPRPGSANFTINGSTSAYSSAETLSATGDYFRIENTFFETDLVFSAGLDPLTYPGTFGGLMAYGYSNIRPQPVKYIAVSCSNRDAPIACPAISCPALPAGSRYLPAQNVGGVCQKTCPAIQKSISSGPGIN